MRTYSEKEVLDLMKEALLSNETSSSGFVGVAQQIFERYRDKNLLLELDHFANRP